MKIYFLFISLLKVTNCLYRVKKLDGSSQTNLRLEASQSIADCIAQGTDMQFLGDDIMHGTINLYNIYVGFSNNDYKVPYQNNKATSTASMIQAFAETLSNSLHSNIQTSYSDTKGNIGANDFSFGGNSFVNTIKTTITDIDIVNFVNTAITAENWRVDSNGIYTVFFRGDIKYYSNIVGDSWNTGWCGFHSNKLTNPKLVIQPMGDVSFLPSTVTPYSSAQIGCMPHAAGTSTSNIIGIWNGVNPTVSTGLVTTVGNYPVKLFKANNQFVESLLSIYMHEIEESITDSNKGWVFLCGNTYWENGDICQDNYGTVFTNSSTGIQYNIVLNDGSQHFVQTNWLYKPNGGKSGCATGTVKLSPAAQPPVTVTKAPSSSSSSSGSCFAGTVTVERSDHTHIPLHAVQLGDSILSANVKGELIYSEVIALPHPINNFEQEFIVLTSENEHELKLTAEHLIMAKKCNSEMDDKYRLMYAKDIQPLIHCLHSIEMNNSKVINVRKIITTEGIYTVVTKEEYIVVDGFIASPYGSNHAIGHQFYNLLRMFKSTHSKTFMDSFIQTTLHNLGILITFTLSNF